MKTCELSAHGPHVSLPSPLSLGAAVVARSAPEETVTSSFASFIHAVRPEHLSKTVRHRSKRMILDSIGVGLVGSTTHVFDIALQYCRVGTAPYLPCSYVVPTLTPPPQPRPYFRADVGLSPCSRGVFWYQAITASLKVLTRISLPFTGAVLFSCCELCLWQARRKALPDTGCVHQRSCGKAGSSRRSSALWCLQRH